FLRQLRHVLTSAIGLHRFPAFCAVLVGGATLLQRPIGELVVKTRLVPTKNIRKIATFLAALFAASVSFALINGGKIPTSRPSATNATTSDSKIQDGLGISTSTLPPELLAGRSIDLTLFALVRALDVLFSSPSSSSSLKRRSSRPTIPWTTIFFTLSSATIMHAWFYSPSRLPRTYNSWISRAAQLDTRIPEALRRCRLGEWEYGRETDQADLLGPVCEEEGIPYESGDPAKTIPVNCEIVNRRRCTCEKHALLRFLQGWCFAALMYFPLHFLVLAKRLYSLRHFPSGRLRAGITDTVRTIIAASRSSSFLGAFIALVYYGVCLGRTRIGPGLLAALTRMRSMALRRVVAQMLDSGLAVTLGCFLCGLSILVEEPKRRVEIMLFVAPRAVGAWIPRRYHRKYLWREHLGFAISTAVVFTAVHEKSGRVRGVLGRVLGDVLKQS
ncbi:hypothetical protein NA57DRAFT_42979, partial [Rhizodiscina lignyota]